MHTTTTTTIPTQRSLFVDPDALICPWVRGAGALRAPPGYWPVHDGLAVPQFFHHDATALCPTSTGVAEPIETA